MRTPRAPKANKTLQMIATDEAAYATIQAQKVARDAKTARLRELRLAREAELAAKGSVEATIESLNPQP